MKKVFTLIAAVAMFATAGFAQQHRTQPGEQAGVNPAAAFKAQLAKKAAMTATKAVGDTVSTFPWTEDFESGVAPAGFTFVDADADGYNWDPTYLYGQGAGHNGSDGMIGSASWYQSTALTPDNWMILPAFVIPSDASGFNLTWYEKGQDASYAEEFYSVYISTTGNATSNFTTAVYSGTATSAWVKKTVDLSSYAGQTIFIAFRHYNITDMFFLDIDDIRVGGPALPELTLVGPAAARTNEAATFTATSDATTFAWYVDGTMEAETSNTLVYTFTTVGTYEVVVEATNTVGTVSDTLSVDVYSCEDITLPYTPIFSDGLGCWDTVSYLTAGTGWHASVDMFASDPEGQVLSISAQSNWFWMEDIPVDNWLLSPVIEMPTTGEEYEVAWQVKAFDADYTGDHYGVYVISGTDTTLLFEETLNANMTEFVQRTAIIPATVTGDFQVAFRHFDSEGGYVIILDAIQIRALTAPVVALEGPESIENGLDATFTAICGNATSFEWTVDGVDANVNTNVLTTSFSTDGIHTVQVIASNNAGEDTASLTIEVYSCDAIAEFPYSIGFEEGIRCWTMISNDPANDDIFGVQEMTGAYEGSYAFVFSSYNSADDYNQYLISPELNLPAGDYMVKFQYAGNSAAESFQVLASTTTNDVAAFTHVLGVYDVTATDWTEVAFRLPAGTKHIAINYYADYQYYLFIDDLSIETLTAPVVTVSGPESAMAGDELVFTANASLADSYTWTVDGVDANVNTNTLTTSFTTAGEHTVQVTATNTVGTSAPATIVVTIFTCDAVTEFPWTADFENAYADYSCWGFIDADGDGYTWDPDFLRGSTDETGNPNPAGHNGSDGMVASASYINNVGALNPDNWLILPAFQLPENSNLILSWFAKGQDGDYFAENYSVYLSTEGRDLASFNTTLYSGVTTASWTGHNADLSAYAGQTVYIAFRHHDVTDMYYLDIDDIRIASEGVGIEEVSNSTVSVYPNPATDIVTVSAEGIEGNATVTIVDINGREMMQQQGNGTFRFDVSSLAAGTYFVRLTGSNHSSVSKLVVK